MITVYGADWCEDTRRALRQLRRLGIAHQYLNIDEDLDALERAKALNHGRRRTPVIDLGFGGAPLVEPDNDSLIGALVERDMLSRDHVVERLAIQNVGDFERVLRTVAGAALAAMSAATARHMRGPVIAAGAITALSGLTGWCPAYHAAGVTSMDGPGDRPDEAKRTSWLVSRTALQPRASALPVAINGTGAQKAQR
jgi:glutaredoxin